MIALRPCRAALSNAAEGAAAPRGCARDAPGPSRDGARAVPRGLRSPPPRLLQLRLHGLGRAGSVWGVRGLHARPVADRRRARRHAGSAPRGMGARRRPRDDLFRAVDDLRLRVRARPRRLRGSARPFEEPAPGVSQCRTGGARRPPRHGAIRLRDLAPRQGPRPRPPQITLCRP